MEQQIGDQELFILSFYRASELAGGLLLGKIAFHTDIDELRSPLTRHAAEEVEHGWLWTKTIRELGLIPLKVTQTYQTEYGRAFGIPTSMIEILGLTQTLEKRVLSHFDFHLNKPNLHPTVKATLEKMIADETGHLSWIKVKLDAYANSGHADEVDALMKKLQEVDNTAYQRLCEDVRFKTFFNIV